MANRKPVEKGIFLGRGLPKDAPASFMDWGFVTLDQDGNFVDMESLPPDTDIGGFKMGGIALKVGQPNLLPTWGESTSKLIAAVASENFAHPKMQEQINQWLEEVASGDELYQKVKEAKGLITLKDVGLDPDTELPVAGDENKGG